MKKKSNSFTSTCLHLYCVVRTWYFFSLRLYFSLILYIWIVMSWVSPH